MGDGCILHPGFKQLKKLYLNVVIKTLYRGADYEKSSRVTLDFLKILTQKHN